jgi:uncharacterized membrane protein YhhN
MKSSKLFLGIFVLVSALHLIGISIGNENLRIITKPLIILSLMIYYSFVVENENHIYLAALFFCFLGDIFLIFNTELNFILGLVSFLIGHILFIVIVVKLLTKSTGIQKIISLLPFTILFAGLMYLLKDNLGGMLIPVIVYGLTISAFGVVALLNYMTEKSVTNLVLLGGALFFILSDSIIALGKFLQYEKYFPLLIMTTYILAQYLICKFMIQKSE